MKLDRSSAPSVLVIPVFNEAQRIDFEFFSAIKNINFDQIIFVDDGSTDLSFQIINDFFFRRRFIIKKTATTHKRLNIGFMLREFREYFFA